MLAAYAAPWPVAMTSVFALTGVVLAIIPVRRSEKWAVWMSVSTFLILLIVRITTDERCLVVLDPLQHGLPHVHASGDYCDHRADLVGVRRTLVVQELGRL